METFNPIMGLFTFTSSVHHGFFVVEIMLLKNNKIDMIF